MVATRRVDHRRSLRACDLTLIALSFATCGRLHARLGGFEERDIQGLDGLLSPMPTLDLWFNAEAGMYHYVAPFLS